MVYYDRGLAYLNKGQNDKALEDFNKAIAINPNYAKAYYNRGVIYYKKWLDEKAISDFRKACDMGIEIGCKTLQKVLKKR